MATKKRAAARTRRGRRPTHDHGDVDTRKNPHGEGYELWDFLPSFVHPAGIDGTPHDHEAADALIETICGATNDSQPVEQYDGTLGVTQQFVADRERAVGQLQWNSNLASIYTNPGTVNGARWCTGTLISCDLFLSAGHCFDQTGGGWMRPKTNGTNDTIPVEEIATNLHVNFNYQVDPAGNLRPVDEYAVTDLVEYRLGGLDFAVVRLDGNPGAKYGWTRISPTDANQNDMVCIIQHPAGLPKRIEAGPLTDLHGGQLGYNDIDTLGGTSGSAVLGPNGRIVGVHTNGGCDLAMIGHNHGVRISSIVAASATVSNLVYTKQPFMDIGCRKFKFLDDRRWKRPQSDFPKGIGDVKAAGYDLRPWFDPRIYGGLGRTGGFGGTRSPFILSTPHHTEPFAGQGFGPGGDVEAHLAELTQMLEAKSQEMAELQEVYEQLLSQLKGTMGGSGGGGS